MCFWRISPEWGCFIVIAMPPAYDLILEWNGVLHTETIEAPNAESARRVGLTSRLGCLKGVVCLDPCSDSVEED